MTVVAQETVALDGLLPEWDCRERHERLIAAPPDAVYAALRQVTTGEVRLLLPLMALRLLPAVLTRRRTRPLRASGPLLDGFLAEGFVLLADTPGREVALGAIGRFWSLAGNAPLRGIDGPDAFRDFDDPGFSKAAMDFRMLPEGGATRLVTETRVVGTDERATRLFRPYWLAIRLGSGAIRHSMLAAVARRAER